MAKIFKEGDWIIATRPLTFNGVEIDRSYMDTPLKVKAVTESHYLLNWYFGEMEIAAIMSFHDAENRGMIIANKALIKTKEAMR